MIVVHLDFETGGTLTEHPSIELGAVAVENGVELSSFEQKLTFDPIACDPQALIINGYSAERWVNACAPAMAAARFAAWLRPFASVTRISQRTGAPYQVARTASYNAPFDSPRLRELFGAAFLPCEMLMRDVLQVVAFRFDDATSKPENYKLTTVAAWFGIPTDGAHGALADARMCAKVHQQLQESVAWL